MIPVGYKDTKIGEIPEDWGVAQLKYQLEYLSSNLSLNKLEENFGEYKLYGASGFIKNIDFYQDEDEYIAIVKDGSGYGNLLWCDKKSSILGTLGRLKAKSNISLLFYFYIMQRINYKRYMSGSTIPHLYFKDYGNINVVNPSLLEQQKIVTIISSVDNAIENTGNIIEKTRELKKGLMQKLFTEGIGHTRFKDTKVGRIPEEWDVLLFKDVFEFISTSSHSKSEMTYDETTSKIFNIHYGAIHTTYKEPILNFDKYNIPKITDGSKMPNEKQYLNSGDLVMVDASEDEDGLGTCVELKNTNNKKIIGGLHTYAVRDKYEKTCEGFRGYIFKPHSVKKVLMSYANCSKVYGITKTALSKIPIILPTISEQRKMAVMLNEVDVKIEKEEATKAQLEQLKKGLMQVLLTGKVRVKV